MASGRSGRKVMIITANVGGIFEIPELMPGWVTEVAKHVGGHRPHFVALHMQEVGGKSPSSGGEQTLELIRLLRDEPGFGMYDSVSGFVDTEVEDDKFTALGSLYFCSKELKAERFDQSKHEFVSPPLGTASVTLACTCPFHGKTKFMVGEFGVTSVKTRKGFIKARWRLHGVDLTFVNVHLFHDASNVEAAEKTPSLYAERRADALHAIAAQVTADEGNSAVEGPHLVCDDGNGGGGVVNDTESSDGPTPMKRARRGTTNDHETPIKEPMVFYAGDFNFRLSMGELVAELTRGGAQGEEQEDGSFVYHSTTGNLQLGQKLFIAPEPAVFVRAASGFQRFDQELSRISCVREPCKVSFPPTYPYKDSAHGEAPFSTKRAPAWPDRVLASAEALKLITSGDVTYDSIGKTSPMGDHKPVAFSWDLPSTE